MTLEEALLRRQAQAQLHGLAAIVIHIAPQQPAVPEYVYVY
jgi:hypothetical protein